MNNKKTRKLNAETYSTATRGSFADRAAYNTRLKIYEILSKTIELAKLESIIDVGVTADKTEISSNFFENLYPDSAKITAFSDQNAGWMESEYPGLKFVQGTALNLPFDDNSFDLVFSSAVIEHVGSFANQNRFIGECFRIARKYVFITTPNRRYPVELHTAMPFIHWLPKKIHRRILKSLGKSFFAMEENLNLLTKHEIHKMCESNRIKDYRILTASFLGLPSNLLFFVTKNHS